VKRIRSSARYVAAFLLIAATATALAGKGLFVKDNTELPKMRTHCIGRYQIDLPEEFTKTAGSYVTLYFGLDKNFDTVEIQNPRERGETPSLERLVGAEKTELVANEHFESPSKNKLAAAKELGRDSVLVVAYNDSRSVDSLKLVQYAQRGEAIAKFANRKYSDRDDSRPLGHFEGELERISRNTRYAATPEQAGRSSCLGTLAIDDKQDGEVYSVSFLSEKHPDIVISINMNSLTEKGDGGLLARVSGKVALLRALDFSSSTLRKGKRKIAGRPGEELLDEGKQEGKVQRYFVAETLVTEPSSLDRPVIAINMSMGGQDRKTGAYVDPSLSEKEALIWWDSIVDSIRLR